MLEKRTFIRNHAQAIVACDFCVVVTASFRLLLVFVVIEHATRPVLKTPPRSPQANALCERLLGTLRRECLDFVMPLTENHLRRLLHEWVLH